MSNKVKKVELTLQGINAIKLVISSSNLDDLLGKVLTILDASLDGEKNKSVKSLVRDAFYRKHDWFSEMAFEEQTSGNEQWKDGLVKIPKE